MTALKVLTCLELWTLWISYHTNPPGTRPLISSFSSQLLLSLLFSFLADSNISRCTMGIYSFNPNAFISSKAILNSEEHNGMYKN